MRIMARIFAVAILTLGGVSGGAAAQDRPNLVVAVNALPGGLESIEEMGNVAVRVSYSMFDSLLRRDGENPVIGGASRFMSWVSHVEPTGRYTLSIVTTAPEPKFEQRLLQEAGYAGEEIGYRLRLNCYVNSLGAAQVMQQMWKAIGLNVMLEPVENETQAAAPGVHIQPWSNTHRFPDPLGSFVPQRGPESSIQIDKKFPDRE